MKHTPGPWHLFERNHLCVESATGNVALCNLARNNEADAKLIAAAPLMLQALEAVLEKDSDAEAIVRAAFEQATR